MSLFLGMIGMSCARGSNEDHSDMLPLPAQDEPLAADSSHRNVVFAAGCFWCTEAVFDKLPGVVAVVPGYSGGAAETATYEQTSTGVTGHAEAIQVTYDPSKITYGRLLRLFFASHDPTQLNYQGPDVGTQYRSAIFYANAEEKRIAEAYIRQLNEAKAFDVPIVTTLEPLEAFYVAEEYHHNYAELHPNQPYIRGVSAPKVKKAQKYIDEETKAQSTTRPATQPG